MNKLLNLTYGKRRFTIDVEFNSRKRLTVTVHPDCTVTAKAPLGYELDVIRHRLERRKSWIVKQISFFEQFQPTATERKYVSGETHYYLGRQYRLKTGKGLTPRVRLMGQYFRLELPEKNNAAEAQKAMRQWYTEHAKIFLAQRVEKYWLVIQKPGIQKPKIQFRRMRKRWGSYSNGGTITLNTELVKLPVHCIDYVIVHELCHIVRADHDRNFYRHMGRILPDWEKRKKRLEKAASEITINS